MLSQILLKNKKCIHLFYLSFLFNITLNKKKNFSELSESEKKFYTSVIDLFDASEKRRFEIIVEKISEREKQERQHLEKTNFGYFFFHFSLNNKPLNQKKKIEC